MYCKDKVLYTDFSGAFGKGAIEGRDQLGDGTIDVRQLSRAMSGTIQYNVPLYATTRPSDGIVDIVGLSVTLNADTFKTPKSIYNLSIDYFGSNPVAAVFLYDAKKNTLLPLKYGDNSSGIARARNLPVSDGDRVFTSRRTFRYRTDGGKSPSTSSTRRSPMWKPVSPAAQRS